MRRAAAVNDGYFIIVASTIRLDRGETCAIHLVTI